MSTEPLECASEVGTSSAEPHAQSHGPINGEDVDLPYRISVEHCYSRLVPFRSSPPPGSLSQSASFPTCVLFEGCIKDKSKLRALNRKWSWSEQETVAKKLKTSVHTGSPVTVNGFQDSSR